VTTRRSLRSKPGGKHTRRPLSVSESLRGLIGSIGDGQKRRIGRAHARDPPGALRPPALRHLWPAQRGRCAGSVSAAVGMRHKAARPPNWVIASPDLVISHQGVHLTQRAVVEEMIQEGALHASRASTMGVVQSPFDARSFPSHLWLHRKARSRRRRQEGSR